MIEPGSVPGSATCPKHMTFGPCGGVRNDGSCEVDVRPCPFISVRPLEATATLALRKGALTAAPDLDLDLGAVPIIVDVRYPRQLNAPAGDVREWWAAAGQVLRGKWALLGEHVDGAVGHEDAGTLDPADAIDLLASAGIRTIATVTGRDRDLVEADATMRRYAAAGASAIHCVTGDHPAVLGLSRSAIFGAESMTILDTAHRLGFAATVAESPLALGDRVARLLMKQHGGASMVLLNHGGDASTMIDFANRCRSAGVRLPLVAPVAMVADLDTGRALAAFPGLQLPPGLLNAINSAEDPRALGLAQAREHTSVLAASGLFAGVNVSGGTVSPDPGLRLDLMSEFAGAVAIAWSSNADRT